MFVNFKIVTSNKLFRMECVEFAIPNCGGSCNYLMFLLVFKNKTWIRLNDDDDFS